MHHFDADYVYGEKAWWQLHKDATSYIKQILEATSGKTTAVWPPTTHFICGGARGVIVIVVGNEHGDTSSNPERDWLHFT